MRETLDEMPVLEAYTHAEDHRDETDHEGVYLYEERGPACIHYYCCQLQELPDYERRERAHKRR